MAINAVRPESLPLKPEREIGPYRGSICVSILRGNNETDDGPMDVRFIKLSPRSYLSRERNKYKSKLYRVDDIPAMIVALQQALEFCYANPIIGDGTHDSDIFL